MSKLFDKVYVDMDQVLVDFNYHFKATYKVVPREYEEEHGTVRFWELLWTSPSFFLDIPPMLHYQKTLNLCKEASGDNYMILSSPSTVNKALIMIQKRQWIDLHIGIDFPAIFEKDKHIYAGKNRLLVDDYAPKCVAWEKQGGITHQFTDYERFEKFIREYKREG